jgi:hypothetical protein
MATSCCATAAYAELTDRTGGLTGRLGANLSRAWVSIGLFDGWFVCYQVNSKFSVSAAAGLPAYTSYSSSATKYSNSRPCCNSRRLPGSPRRVR